MNTGVIQRQNQQTQLTILVISVVVTMLSFAFITLLSPTKASAATITVGGACTLDDAVASMNAASDQSGCNGTGVYGTDDTIDIPAGTHSYSANADLSVPVEIAGAGMGDTILDFSSATGGSLAFDKNDGTNQMAVVRDLSIMGLTSSVGAISIDDFSTTIQRVEIYSETNATSAGGIGVSHNFNGFSTLIEEVYIHNISFSGAAMSISQYSGTESSSNVIRRSTLSDINLTSLPFLVNYAVYGGGSLTGVFENATIQDVDSLSPGLFVSAYSDQTPQAGNGSVDLDIRNNTFNTLSALTSSGAVFGAISVAPSGSSASASIELQNNLVKGNVAGTQYAGFAAGYEVGGGGSESATVTSLGGNITDDSAPQSIFALTEPTDQSGVTNLGSTLGPLQNNGGITPTMALLTGSPAIDAGVANDLTTDQRGIARPQGSGYDSGAYELVVASDNTDNAGGSTTAEANQNEDRLADTGQNTKLLFLIAVGLVGLSLASRLPQSPYAKIRLRIKK